MGFGYLVIPPVVAPRVSFVPVFKPFLYFVEQAFVFVIFVLRVGIGKCKIIKTVYMCKRRPVGALYTGIVYVGKGTIDIIVVF